jgi:hypothetical protein
MSDEYRIEAEIGLSQTACINDIDTVVKLSERHPDMLSEALLDDYMTRECLFIRPTDESSEMYKLVGRFHEIRSGLGALAAAKGRVSKLFSALSPQDRLTGSSQQAVVGYVSPEDSSRLDSRRRFAAARFALEAELEAFKDCLEKIDTAFERHLKSEPSLKLFRCQAELEVYKSNYWYCVQLIEWSVAQIHNLSLYLGRLPKHRVAIDARHPGQSNRPGVYASRDWKAARRTWLEQAKCG